MTSTIFSVILGVLLSGVVCFGQSPFLGLKPGSSTRAEVEKVLGPSTRELSPTRFAYAPQSGIGPIEVEYGAGAAVVERLEVHFLRPILRAALVERLQLPSHAQPRQTTAQGQLVETWS